VSAYGTSGHGTFNRGGANSRAAESGSTAAPVVRDSHARAAPLDARAVLSAHLAGLALTAGSITGFTVLVAPLLHWLAR